MEVQAEEEKVGRQKRPDLRNQSDQTAINVADCVLEEEEEDFLMAEDYSEMSSKSNSHR